MANPSLYAADCGCCAGLDTETPRRIGNRPGQSAIAYRVGDYAQFKESLLAGLSSPDYPALRDLRTREDGDFTVALCDALATTMDVLTFYQERIANEHYLRTAIERRSVAAMARLIGYVPSPGVAASTHLAFTLQEAPGDTTQSAEPVTIPKGTRVQSVPGPNEQPQVFETVEDTEARVEWNAIVARANERWRPLLGDTDLYLRGVSTQLQPGDAIVIVGRERSELDTGSEQWDVRILASVEPDTVNSRTRLIWTEPLGHRFPRVRPAAEAVQVFALRQRAALFGHNAPDPNLFRKGSDTNLEGLVDVSNEKWAWLNYQIDGQHIDLDAAYLRITAGSWIVLVSNVGDKGAASLPGYAELYRAKSVRQVSRTGFGLSARITRIEPDTRENLTADRFHIQETLVLAQSEALPTAARPLSYPVYGSEIALDLLVQGLASGRAVAVSGKRQRIAVAPGLNTLKFTPDDGDKMNLSEGDSLILLEAPVQVVRSTSLYLKPESFGRFLGRQAIQLRLRVLDRDGRSGTLLCTASQIILEDSRKEDPEVAEIAVIASDFDAADGRDRITLRLEGPLTHCYERKSVRLNANVARATHGETVGRSVPEILGNGDASRPDQTFVLRQPPVTFVGGDTPSGRVSTLEVRVNDLRWSEAPTLYRRDPDDRVYAVGSDEDGRATVRFGDGVEGARLPTGQNNVRATYRKGLGVAGNVAAGKLTNLLSRPLGVNGVTNPEAATGGEDRETLDAARENAPLTVRTLDRAVSLQDYVDFARAFAGIAKAHALWIPTGPARGVFLTVAGIDGAPVDEKSDTYRNLLAALRRFGAPLAPVHLADHRAAVFHTSLAVRVAGDRDTEKVLAEVGNSLRMSFAFDRRDFGQGVSVDEVMAVAHRLDGVEAVQVTKLYRLGPAVPPIRLPGPFPRPPLGYLKKLGRLYRWRQPVTYGVQPRLFAELPIASLNDMPQPAELLTLDADGLELRELT